MISPDNYQSNYFNSVIIMLSFSLYLPSTFALRMTRSTEGSSPGVWSVSSSCPDRLPWGPSSSYARMTSLYCAACSACRTTTSVRRSYTLRATNLYSGSTLKQVYRNHIIGYNLLLLNYLCSVKVFSSCHSEVFYIQWNILVL